MKKKPRIQASKRERKIQDKKQRVAWEEKQAAHTNQVVEPMARRIFFGE